MEASIFLLKYLEVKEDEKEVLNIDFIGDREVVERPIFSTLILGENGTGKSFLLKTIVDIFVYISKAQIYKRKPKFKYSKFCFKYSIDGNEYCVKKESGRDIFCWKNAAEIVLDEIELPKKVLAVSFMVNDKFCFVKPGEDIGSIYKYLGVRKSTNSTYTSSVMQNVFYSVVHMMKNQTITELEKVLTVLHFDSNVEISFKLEKCNSESKMKKSNCIRKCSIDCSNPDYGKIEEILEELEQASSSLDDKEKNKCNIAFYKNGRCIHFGDCSSGEKHMIFAFTGVLSSIESKSIVLIDEPEISLHPEWQIQYVSLLKKIFKKYDGLETSIYKDLDEEGVEISGGEAQKIALARALYKNAPFIILDEPTAALDPIAEYEVYSKFNEIVQDKTAIYISHRLSSCRFCDVIAVFDDGQIVQMGVHDKLLQDTHGKYYELWNAQAQYYT